MFKGLGQLGDMASMLKQAQEMQGKLKDAQNAIEALEIEESAGAGMVKVTVNGKGTILKVEIDPEIFAAGDKVVAEDLIVAAANNAQKRASDEAQSRMSEITGGLPIPDEFKSMF